MSKTDPLHIELGPSHFADDRAAVDDEDAVGEGGDLTQIGRHEEHRDALVCSSPATGH